MSKFNPATPLIFSYELWHERQVVVGRIDDWMAGYFAQGDDGQWWWFAIADGGDSNPLPVAASNLMQIVAYCHELNANGWQGVA